MMRSLLFGCALGLGLAATAATGASAQDEGLFPWQVSRNYPWCAFLNGPDVAECLYFNVAQCRATISGVGGYCYRNPAYVAPPPPVRRPPRVRRHHRS